MIRKFRLDRFGGLAPRSEQPAHAESMRNMTVADGRLRFRNGYRNLFAAPGGSGENRGFLYLSGYDDLYKFQEEYLSFQKLEGAVQAYRHSADGRTRTALSAVGELPDSSFHGFAFGGVGYLIAPGAERSLWRRSIGTTEPLIPLQDQAYTPPPSDPDLTIDPQAMDRRGWRLLGTSPDSVTVTSTDGILDIGTTEVDGSVLVLGRDNDNGKAHRTQVTMVFAEPLNADRYDHFAIEVVGGAVFETFSRTGAAFEVRIGGVWQAVEAVERFNDPLAATRMVWVVRLRGVTGRNALEGLRFRLTGRVTRFRDGTAFEIRPIWLGGTHLVADSPTDRLWDFDAEDPAPIRYGVRYLGPGVGDRSVLKQREAISEVVNGAPFAVFGPSSGARLRLTTPPAEAGGFTEVQYLRFDPAAEVWRELGRVPHLTDEPTEWIDTVEAHTLASLPAVTDLAEDSPQPVPPFQTQGLVGGAAYKGWVVWLFQGGKGNVRHSRVGVAEELFSEEAAYSPEDEGQPGDYSLAEDFGDEPVGAVAAGPSLIVLGKRAVYSQAGERPSAMTPLRQIPGSNGVLGPRAFVRYRPPRGGYGCAFVDADFNVWFVAAEAGFDRDAQVRPLELSAAIRGTVREFLYEAQRPEFPTLQKADLQLDCDHATGSLWLVLGRRAMVFRPVDPEKPALDDSGIPTWEAYEYALSQDESETIQQVWTPALGATGAISSLGREGSTTPWSDPSFAALTDENAATLANVAAGDVGEELRGLGVAGWTQIPPDATIDRVRMVLHTNVSGETPIEIDRADVWRFDGEEWAVADSYPVPRELPTGQSVIGLEIDLPGTVSADDLRLGRVGWGLGVRSKLTDPDLWDPSRWEVTVSPSTPLVELGGLTLERDFEPEVRVRYVGPGEAPARVKVSISAELKGYGQYVGGGPALFAGTATLTLQGETESGAFQRPSLDLEEFVRLSRTFSIWVDLVDGEGVAPFEAKGRVDLASSSGSVAALRAEFGAELVPLAPTDLNLDWAALQVRWQRTLTEPNGEPRWSAIAFGPDRRMWAIRVNGSVDELEWDSEADRPIEGRHRDGGNLPPYASWRSVPIPGNPQRLARTTVTGENLGTVLSGANGKWGSPLNLAASSSASFLFPPELRDRSFRLEVRFPSSDLSTFVDSLAAEWIPLSSRGA